MRALFFCVALSGCQASPPMLHVVAAGEVGVLGQSAHIIGRDGGWGARLWGKEAFLFGDSAVTPADANGSTFHSNSVSFTDDLDASDGIADLVDPLDAVGSPRPLIAPTTDEAAFNAAHAGDNCAEAPCGARFAMWPGATVYDPVAGQAIVAYGLIHAEPGAFNFQGLGQSLALWKAADQQAERPTPGNCPDHPTLLFCAGEPAWGMALYLDGTDLYAFDCPQSGLSNSCIVARVPVAAALDRSAWQAWNGAGFGDLNNARGLFEGGNSLRIGTYDGVFIAVYSGAFSNDVSYRTAPALTGPWSDAALLFKADHRSDDGGGTYDATLQPDYQTGADMYVTYSRPTGTFFGSEIALEKVTLSR